MQQTSLHALTGASSKSLERALIGSIMLNTEVLNESWALMPVEVFYFETHRHAWNLLNEMHKEFEYFDICLFAERLTQRHGVQTMLEITGILSSGEFSFQNLDVPSSVYAWSYALELKRLFVKRERAKATIEYHTKITENGDDSDARLELEAVLMVLDQMLKPDETISDEEIAALMGPTSYFPTGYPDIDVKLQGLSAPGLNILVAQSSVGKSSLARGMIRRAIRRGESVFYYSQDQASNQIYKLEAARLLQIDSNQVPYLPDQQRLDVTRRITQEVWCNRVKLIDYPLKLSQLCAAAKSSGCTFIVIDYLQIIDAGMNERFLNITETSMALKSLALQLRVPVLALAQFNRKFVQGEKPQMDWIDGSSQIEKDADIILAILRDKTNNNGNGNIIGMKNKTGGNIDVWVKWVGKYASYESMATDKYDDSFYGN
jgi:replicative DNA helicase